MVSMDQDMVKRLLVTFMGEAKEHLGTISASLIELENSRDEILRAELLETAYRCTHSLKGGARIVNLTLIEMLCQTFEECFAGVRKGALQPDRQLLDLMHETTDIIGKILFESPPEAPPAALKSKAIQLRKRLEQAVKVTKVVPPSSKDINTRDPSKAESAPLSTKPAANDNAADTSEAVIVPESANFRASPVPGIELVKVPAARLDSILVQAEELTSLKLAIRQSGGALKEIMDDLATIRRSCESSRSWTKNDIRELDRTLAITDKKLTALKKNSDEDYHQASGMVDSLIQSAKSLVMFPFSIITEGLTKLIREMAREQGKEVKLFLDGETIELDRRLLQEIKDPLMHLVRNCVDHAIETPEERLAAGKSSFARIQVGLSIIENGKARVIVQDDGNGFDIAAIISSAVSKGIITADYASTINEEEALQLVFHSGLSSRQKVSTISGRGLGMAIVKEKVQALGGSLAVESFRGQGTSFIIELPLTLATFRGIRIRVGKRFFAVPTLEVQQVSRLLASEFTTIGNRETIVMAGQTIPVVQLAGVLRISGDDLKASRFRTIMVLGNGLQQMAFEVDEVCGEDDMLVKKLGPQLVRVKNVSGATVQGDGTVTPILNVADLLASLGSGTTTVSSEQMSGNASILSDQTTKRIMVVDDSITSRTLLKNVIESYGYEVHTACDGVDALGALQNAESFDLATIDVEMPRMDGIELTTRLRADERFSRLPIVLITSLDSVEDKRRGIDAGADAYIVKSSFDQSNLLDIIKKLI